MPSSTTDRDKVKDKLVKGLDNKGDETANWDLNVLVGAGGILSSADDLASIIRGYKTGVTKYARNNNIDFGWQSRFHDHIIRNNAEYQRIKNYIISNPKNRNDDSMNA